VIADCVQRIGFRCRVRTCQMGGGAGGAVVGELVEWLSG